jgi:hypothetical protein
MIQGEATEQKQAVAVISTDAKSPPRPRTGDSRAVNKQPALETPSVPKVCESVTVLPVTQTHTALPDPVVCTVPMDQITREAAFQYAPAPENESESESESEEIPELVTDQSLTDSDEYATEMYDPMFV